MDDGQAMEDGQAAGRSHWLTGRSSCRALRQGSVSKQVKEVSPRLPSKFQPEQGNAQRTGGSVFESLHDGAE
jgi:hypothetical protein